MTFSAYSFTEINQVLSSHNKISATKAIGKLFVSSEIYMTSKKNYYTIPVSLNTFIVIK